MTIIAKATGAGHGLRTRLALALTLVLGVVVAALLVHARHRAQLEALLRADPDAILGQAAWAQTALPLGRTVFERHCASCHGDGGANASRGTPDLRTGKPLFGTGRAGEVEQIVLYGIRAGHSKGRNLASMPAYASLHPYGAEAVAPLTPADIDDVTQYLLGFTGRTTDRAAADRGAKIFSGKGGCYDCHAADAKGDPAIGAPDLTDAVWLYGDGTAGAIRDSIAYGRAGMCPAFTRRLSALDARVVALYVASLRVGRAP